MSNPIKIRMGGYGPPTTSFSRALQADRRYALIAAFGDRVDVKYVWNIMDFGYRAEEILWLVEDGVLTLGYQSSSYLTDRVPELGFVDLPFLFQTRDQARAAMDGALGRFLAAKIEERVNYRILGWFENGFRQISNRLRRVRVPADLKGMRIRVLPSEVQARTFELLGAIPVRCDLTEAIAGIKAGTLDAQENPFANTVTYGVHKFHRFHTVTNHFYISRPIFLHRPSVRRVAGGPAKRHARGGRRARSRFSANSPSRRTARRAPPSKRRAAKSPNSRPTSTPNSAPPSRRCSTMRADLRAEIVRSYSGSLTSAATLIGRGEDQRPEYLVFRFRRIDRGDAHAGDACVEHIGAVRRRIAPAGKRLGERVVAGGNILDRHAGVEAGFADALLERRAGIVIELVARRHGLRLLGGELHQFGIDRDRRRGRYCRDSRKSSIAPHWRRARRPVCARSL